MVGLFDSDSIDLDPGFGESWVVRQGYHEEALVLKLTNEGDLIWGHVIGGSALVGQDRATRCAINQFDEILIIGGFQDTIDLDLDPNSEILYVGDGENGNGSFILQLNANGEHIWSSSFHRNSTPYDVEFDNLGCSYVAGVFTDSVDFDFSLDQHVEVTSTTATFLLKQNPQHEFLRVDVFENTGGGGLARVPEITIDSNNGVWLTTAVGIAVDTLDINPTSGVFEVINTHDYAQVIVKLSEDGDFEVGGIMNAVINDLICDSENSLYAIAVSAWWDDMALEVGGQSWTSSFGGIALCLFKLTYNGTIEWVRLIDYAHPGSYYGACIALDSLDIVFGGLFANSPDMDPDPNTVYQIIGPSTNSRDAFVAKWSQIDTNVGLTVVEPDEGISIYPNPSNGVVFIRFREEIKGAFMLEVTDMAGQKVLQTTHSSSMGLESFQMNIAGWSAGIYHLSLTSAKTRYHSILIKNQ